MADGERLGASFSIDTTALKAGLAQANRLIRESESEFKAAAAGMDDWSDSQDGLEARIKHLNNAQDLQQKKVEALQKQYEEAGYASDDMSAAAVKLRTDINKEKEALAKTERELRQQTQALDDLKNASDDASDGLDDVSEAAKDSADGFTVAKGAASDLIANGITALAGACKNAISSIAGLADSTRESRTEFAKLEQSFDSAGLGAEAAEKTMSDLYGILGDTGQAAEASNLIAKMSKDQADLDKNTRILTGVFAEYGSSIPTEGLAEAMASTSAMSSVQGVLADALEWQGVNLDEYNEKLASMSTEEERAAYIQDTLTELYGESADAYRENNKELIDANEAQLEYEKTMARFGDKVEPITTKVKEGFNKILEKVLELVDGVDLDAFGDKIESAFDVFINDVIPKVLDIFGWIKDNGKTISDILLAIGAGFATFAVVEGIIKGITAAQAAWNAVMAVSPITWIILGIAALVAGIVLLIRNWDKVKEAGAAAWEWIKGAWESASTWFHETIIQPIVDFFSGLWDGIKNGASNAWEGIKSVFSSVATFFEETFSKAWEKVKNVFSKGGKIFDGIKDGIVTAFKAVVNALIDGINKVVKVPFDGLNKVLDTISGLTIAGLKPFDWLTWRATIPQIPHLANGGIVNRATTALIGEDGAEAVIPLERNKQWIKEVAKEIALAQPNGVVVNQTNNYSQAHSRIELYKTKQQTAAAVRLALGGA